MSCEEFRDLLALYAGGESYPNERPGIEEHLGVCSACARELDLYREMRASLSSLRETEAPPGTWTSIWTGLRTELFPGRRSRLGPWGEGALRYAALLLLGVGLGVGAYRLSRGAAPGLLSRAPEAPLAAGAARGGSEGFPVRPPITQVNSSSNPEPAGEFRFFLPRVVLEEKGYLPRVESFPKGGEKDF